MEEKVEKPLQINILKLMETYFYIVDKEQNDVLFKLNPMQRKIYDDIKEKKKKNEKFRGIVLKARQLGISTFSIMLMLALAITTRNFNGMLITHKEDISRELFSRLKHAFYSLPKVLRPSILKDNDGELIFDKKDGSGLNSKIKIRVASENSTGLGRGETLNYLHISEYPQWKLKNKSVELGSILNACTSNSIVINEATARGYDDFKTRFDKARNKESNEIAYFFPWFLKNEYSHEYKGFELTDEELELKEKFNLNLNQLQFRRDVINDDFAGDENIFKQEYPSTPEEAFLSSGDCIYNLNVLNDRIREIRKNGNQKYDIGYFRYRIAFDSETMKRSIVDIKWVSDHRNGYITIFKNVEERRPYIIGVDPAGEGSDFNAGIVIDNITSEQIATLHKENLETLNLSAQIYCLSKYYNNALIIPETNYSVGLTSTLKEFEANLYISENEANSIANSYTNKYGFRTTPRTRPLLIDLSKQYINFETKLINDVRILNEAQNFVRIYKVTAEKTTCKEQANVGAHDDLLFALMLALYARESGQQDFQLFAKEEEEEKGISEYEFIFGKDDDYDDSSEWGYLSYD